MFVVQALLQIFRSILGETKRDHLQEELLGVRRQRLESQLVACPARELVAAFAHGVPVALALPGDRGRHCQVGGRIACPLLLVTWHEAGVIAFVTPADL
jgi:hypothetical protein